MHVIGTCYQRYTTTSSMESWNISINLMHTTTYNSFYAFLEKHLTFSTETLGNVIIPHKGRKKITMGIKKELVRLSDVVFQD